MPRQRLDALGRLFIPRPCRQELGIENGSTLSVTLENGTIIIRRDEEERISEIVQNCLWQYHGEGTPIDLLKIARGAGIKVIANKDIHCLKQNMYGRTYSNGSQWIIIYDDTLPLEKRKITVAHELGHVFLQHDKEHERFQAYIKRLQEEHPRHVEHEADLFAKYLLNPLQGDTP